MKRIGMFGGIAAVLVLGFGILAINMSRDDDAGKTSDISSAQSLDLHRQNLTHLPANLFTQTELVTLNLSENHITGALPAEIRFLQHLVVLDASENDMTGVPAEIGQLKQLKTLDLSRNRLTGLPLEIGNLSALETLDLRGNDITATDLVQIRASLPQTTILVDE